MKHRNHGAASAAETQATGAELVKFDFHGDELDVVTTPDGEHWVVLARLCEPFNLRVDGQVEKLDKLAWARTQKIWVRDSRGQEQEIVCLNIRCVAGWLFTINAGKVAEHLREKLGLYQRECAEVLADHFLGKRGAVEDGEKTRDLVAGLYLRVEGLERLLHGAAANAGTISGIQADGIAHEVSVLGHLRVALGYNKNLRGGIAWINQRIAAAAQWGGTGMRRRFMPSDRYPLVRMCLETIRADLDAEARRRKLKSATALLKRSTQEPLFRAVPTPEKTG